MKGFATNLSYYVRVYLTMQKKYIQSRMQYRLDFVVSLIGILMLNAVSLISLWLLMQSTSDIVGWTLNELIFIYGFFLIAYSPAQILFDNMWNLNDYVRDGKFIKYYFRPMNMLFSLVAERFDIKGLGQFAMGIVAFVYGSVQVGIDWTAVKLFWLVLFLFGAALINIGFLVGSACAGFWMTWSFSVMDFIFRTRDFGRYPTTIFAGSFRTIFTWIFPIGFLAFYPSQYFLRDSGNVPLLTYFTPLVGIVVFGLSCIIWREGVQQYNGTGS